MCRHTVPCGLSFEYTDGRPSNWIFLVSDALQLETSTSFFKAMQDPTLLPPVLDQICSADADTCLDVMDQYALQIDQSDTCECSFD